MEVVFAGIILMLTLVAWAPIAWNHKLLPTLRQFPLVAASLLFFTGSAVLQLVFVTCVGTRLLTLDYSLKFVAVGIPCCVLGAAGAFMSGARFIGVAISSVLSFGLWLFLAMLH